MEMQELLKRFGDWKIKNKTKKITAWNCAEIAIDYHNEQLRLLRADKSVNKKQILKIVNGITIENTKREYLSQNYANGYTDAVNDVTEAIKIEL